MAETSTQLKLRTTPTAGVEGEHSPYYRRLLSAGYKGFLQGTIGGSTLYGALGLGVGALVTIPAFFLVGPAAFTIIPAMGGLGIMKGASTFGNIGSVAAISAESAEMSEKRRYLLDRYYDLPETPEFDKEANQIEKMLNSQHNMPRPEGMFHWKTVAIGAALGAAIAFGLMVLPGSHLALLPLIETFGAPGVSIAATAIGTMLGAASGAMIGLDRFYVRKWFDFSEGVVHDKSKVEQAIAVREQEIEELGKGTVVRKDPTPTTIPAEPIMGAPSTVARIAPEAIAEVAEKPTTKTTNYKLQDRVAEIQQAMRAPAV